MATKKAAKSAAKRAKKLPAKTKLPGTRGREPIEKDLNSLVWRVVEAKGLPKGPLKKLLEKKKIDKALIEKIIREQVPYGYT